ANAGPSDHFGIAVALYGNHLAVGARYHASATGRSGAVFTYEAAVGLQTTTIQYQYDPLYRLTKADYSGDISASYAYVYDAVGNMTAFTETVGITTTAASRTFNAANQLQTSLDAVQDTTSFYYDENGNMVEIWPPGASQQNQDGIVRYGYNQRNLLQTQETYNSGWTLQVAYVYDGDNGRIQQIDYTGPTAVTTTYHNDNMGLSQVLIANDGTTQTANLFGLDLIHVDDGSQTRTLLADGLG
ncbi:MAG: hypothetical protein GY797_21270, partial [Deltaproteobacteria bacterium]|nr:hypothetical protein [Deltaproteobacteria bacterium]